jgi:hypothetical protein
MASKYLSLYVVDIVTQPIIIVLKSKANIPNFQIIQLKENFATFF